MLSTVTQLISDTRPHRQSRLPACKRCWLCAFAVVAVFLLPSVCIGSEDVTAPSEGRFKASDGVHETQERASQTGLAEAENALKRARLEREIRNA